MGMKSMREEILQVQDNHVHIVKSTARKDRHSKVYTTRGVRDRRVRLSAHTAIQFYDVQDRLGYDRPSKAVDWLIKQAKSAIDKLSQLPPTNTLQIDSSLQTHHDSPRNDRSGNSGLGFDDGFERIMANYAWDDLVQNQKYHHPVHEHSLRS